MQIDATLTKAWKKRWLMLTGFIFAGALWFYYDGFVGYPKVAERYQVYRVMADELISSGKAVSEQDRMVVDTWREYATSQGWKREVPKNKTASDFANQKKYGTFLVGISILLLGWYYKSSKMTVRFDGNTITGTDGTEVSASDIFELDKRKWENKGIVYAHYKETEASKKITLDAYKFEGVEKIIEDLEGLLGTKEKTETTDT